MKCRWGYRYGYQATRKAERKLKGEVRVWVHSRSAADMRVGLLASVSPLWAVLS